MSCNLIFSTNYTNIDAINQLSINISQILSQLNAPKKILIVCIGTDRSTGDSLGPLTGTLLEDNNITCLQILGSLDSPVHALNLETTINLINNKYSDHFVIAIDACLGKNSNVGHLQLIQGPLRPGAGVAKDLPSLGDLHINGIVNIAGFMEYFVLQNTRLNKVMKMAKIISSALEKSISNYVKSSSSKKLKLSG